MFEATLAARQRILGPEHPDTLHSRNNLARAYRDAGRVDEAIPLIETSLAARERIEGPEHPATLGIIAILAGVGLFSGAIWARTVAVIVAMVSIIANFVWLPYYPWWWALLVIVLDFFVIWAVVLHGRDVTAE